MIEHNFPIILNNKEVGKFQLQEITKITYAVHMQLIDEEQNKGQGVKCFDQLVKKAKELNILNLIATVPILNIRMVKTMDKTPFKITGSIKNGIIWNNILQDLIIYQYEVT